MYYMCLVRYLAQIVCDYELVQSHIHVYMYITAFSAKAQALHSNLFSANNLFEVHVHHQLLYWIENILKAIKNPNCMTNSFIESTTEVNIYHCWWPSNEMLHWCCQSLTSLSPTSHLIESFDWSFGPLNLTCMPHAFNSQGFVVHILWYKYIMTKLTYASCLVCLSGQWLLRSWDQIFPCGNNN